MAPNTINQWYRAHKVKGSNQTYHCSGETLVIHLGVNLATVRYWLWPGADPGFQVRGGGGAHLKKLRRAEEGAKILGVFRVKNHYFTPKNPIFYNCEGWREIFLGYFVWKITILRQKIIFFPILEGCPPPPPPWIRPWWRRLSNKENTYDIHIIYNIIYIKHNFPII